MLIMDSHLIRYPPLDPLDPFAPLDTLRGRVSSQTHPTLNDFLPKKIKDPHYRRRSQSIPSSPPSLRYHSFTQPLTPVQSINGDDSSTLVESHNYHDNGNRYRCARTPFPLLTPDSPPPPATPITTATITTTNPVPQSIRKPATRYTSLLPYYQLSPKALDLDSYLDQDHPISPISTTPRSLARPSTAETFASLLAESESPLLSPAKFTISLEPSLPQDLALHKSAKPSRHNSTASTVNSRTYKSSSIRSHSRSALRRRLPPPAPILPKAPFDEYKPPTLQQLTEAAFIDVIGETGLRVPFGELWLDKKTIVCFIRHFWCPSCQDYMYSISRNVSPKALRRAGINLVIIGNGSHNMIKSYRQIFRTSLSVYTDPTNRLYATLGMTFRTLNPGPNSQRGSYVRHGLLRGVAMVMVNAVKVRMPLLEHGGNVSQLGGEFVLGPGLVCSYAHRMVTTRSHAPIIHVMEFAGVDVYGSVEHVNLFTTDSTTEMSDQEREKWMVTRQEELEKLKLRKACRRRGIHGSELNCWKEDQELEKEQKPAVIVQVTTTTTDCGDEERESFEKERESFEKERSLTNMDVDPRGGWVEKNTPWEEIVQAMEPTADSGDEKTGSFEKESFLTDMDVDPRGGWVEKNTPWEEIVQAMEQTSDSGSEGSGNEEDEDSEEEKKGPERLLTDVDADEEGGWSTSDASGSGSESSKQSFESAR